MSNSKITAVILIVISIYLVGYFLFQNSITNTRDNVIGILNNITASATKGDWARTNTNLRKLEIKWDKTKYLLALNYAEPDYLVFTEYLSRLKGAVEERDLSEVKSNILVIKDFWINFTKLIPLP